MALVCKGFAVRADFDGNILVQLIAFSGDWSLNGGNFRLLETVSVSDASYEIIGFHPVKVR